MRILLPQNGSNSFSVCPGPAAVSSSGQNEAFQEGDGSFPVALRSWEGNSRGRADPGGAWLAVREPICQLACHSARGFKGSMTFSTVSGRILWWWKAEVSVLVLK